LLSSSQSALLVHQAQSLNASITIPQGLYWRYPSLYFPSCVGS
jgi:hypothetical protein